jgi:hypothetical protein
MLSKFCEKKYFLVLRYNMGETAVIIFQKPTRITAKKACNKLEKWLLQREVSGHQRFGCKGL